MSKPACLGMWGLLYQEKWCHLLQIRDWPATNPVHWKLFFWLCRHQPWNLRSLRCNHGKCKSVVVVVVVVLVILVTCRTSQVMCTHEYGRSFLFKSWTASYSNWHAMWTKTRCFCSRELWGGEVEIGWYGNPRIHSSMIWSFYHSDYIILGKLSDHRDLCIWAIESLHKKVNTFNTSKNIISRRIRPPVVFRKYPKNAVVATIGWCQPLTAWSKLRSHDPIWLVLLYLPSVWNMNNFNDASDVSNPINMGGGFKYFLCSPLFGEDSRFDTYFSTGLKPPTGMRWYLNVFFQSTSSEQNRNWQIMFLRNRGLVLLLSNGRYQTNLALL